MLFFSYFLLFSFDPISQDKQDIHWTEILTIIFVASMLFEEFRQVFNLLNFLFLNIKLFSLLSSILKMTLLGWVNFIHILIWIIECLIYSLSCLRTYYSLLDLYYVLLLRIQINLQLQGKYIIAIYLWHKFDYYRIVMAYDLEIWFIRSILFIGIAPNLGPKLVMIRKMVNYNYKNFFLFYIEIQL